jgi:hypothetical protein
LKPQCCGKEDVRFASLDFLDSSDVQVHEFSELFLRDVPCNALTAQVCSECRKLLGDFRL